MIYPLSVECAASQHSWIRRAALAPSAGRRILLLETSGIEPDLHCLRESLQWARIDSYKTVKRIPLDPRHNAKVDYPALAELL